MNTLTLSELNALTDAHLLDVRSAASFQAGALPSAVNNCVFEVVFLSRMPEAWSPHQTVVVIGQSEESQEAVMAAEKLDRAGFTDVRILAGGMDAAGYPVPAPVSPAFDGELLLDLERSTLQWTGRNLLNKHTGTLGLSAGCLSFSKGTLTGGDMTLDWDSLQCEDLAGTELHDVLMHHLKDHDFFDVGAFPAPEIALTSARPLPGGTDGAPTLELTADLTMKGVTRPVTFPVTTGVDPDGGFALNGHLEFDRTDWNVRYGSGKLFRNLGMHLVNDRIELGVNLVTQPDV